jgi:hypothetical protein
MARCKSCGAPIIWIRSFGGAGKPMPCDQMPLRYRPDANGGSVLVTGAGRVVRGVLDPDSEMVGYTSHFATCPHSAEHRRPKRDDGEQLTF